MKCDFCGQPLSLEEEYCEHCGQINPHAQQHIRDMRHYKGEFENTKRGVYALTGVYKDITVRAVIITALVVLIVVMLYLYENVYGLHRDYLRSDAKRNVKEYTAVMDKYIEEEDFRRFMLFCEEHAIGSYTEGYENYTLLIRATDDYVWFCDAVMEVVTASPENVDIYRNRVVDYLNYFYDTCDWLNEEDVEGVTYPEDMKTIRTMENNMMLMLQTYLGFTEEETAGMSELSEAKRTVLFEEKFK